MRKMSFLLIGAGVLAALVTAALLIPNPARGYVLREAKANGYIKYSPEEALVMAKRICTQCHSDERIKLYCPRCGPPFVAVVPHMQTFINNFKQTKPNLKFENITESQAVAIVQVWNALVGNWEHDFRKQDILKLIGHFDQLAALYQTPVEQRPIEHALSQRDDLKIGHMSGLLDAQKNLGKQGATAPAPGSDKMGHGMMDHSKMDHGMMDHNKHKM